MNTKRGRPRKKVNPAAFKQEKAAFQLREITAEKAAENLGIGRATFFRMLKEEQAGPAHTGAPAEHPRHPGGPRFCETGTRLC